MNALSRFFIRRPIGCILLAIAIVLAGLLALRLLPVAPLPRVDFPVIQVRASLPGASPESMASTVAAPLERALGSIAGVTGIRSSSNQGSTNVTLQFDLTRDIDDAAREVQAAINASRGQLPSGMSGNPSFVKVNPSQAPIMALALSSPRLPPSALYDNASTVLAQKLAQVVGVGEVTVDGSSLPAVRVQARPEALAHRGLSLDDVRSAIADANAWRPVGQIEQDAQRWQIALPAPLRTAADFEQLVVRHDAGTLVRLHEVASVTDSVENRYTAGYHNDRPAVVLLVSRRPGANIVETIDAINAQLPQLRALLPADTALRVVMDRSPGIRATLREAQFTLVLTCVLVMAVVWAFLASFRTALIPALALPVSLVGSFAVMWWQGFSLNNLSLMALIVAAGLVVDDAIVVLENIQRHIETARAAQAAAGQREVGRRTVWRAALTGAGEVGFTLLAMNLALIVVFVSVLFMGGVVERLFREFAITLVAAMLISLAVSVTLTPALCAHGLPAGPPLRQPGALARFFHSLLADVQHGYARSLDFALRHRFLTLLLLLATVALNVWLYVAIPKGMLPQQDTGQLSGFVRGDDGFSFQGMQPKVEAFRRLLVADPAVADVTGVSGGRTGTSNSWFRIRLKPLAERREPASAVVARLRAAAPKIAGGILFVSVDQDIRLSSGGGDGEYAFVMRSDSLEDLRRWTRPVGEALRALPELADVDIPGGEDAQQVVLSVDREAARRLGVRMDTVTTALNNAFSQRQVATLYDALNQYRVVMEADPRGNSEPSALDHLQLQNDAGERVPLSAIATWRYGLTRDRVNHDAQFASAGIGYGLAPGVSLQQAQQAIERAVGGLLLPTSIATGEYKGDPNSLQQTLKRQPWLILAVLVTVYLVLGMLYESTLHPLTILSTLPSAGVGALLALRISDTEFSLIALLGLFLLIGVVMKNAILMIDFALSAQRTRGLSAQDAIFEAAQRRLRPILMTNLAALLGAVPLVLGLGEGSELRRPLGIAIIGGLMVSQLLTLYTTPVVYLVLERLRRRAPQASSADPTAAKTA
ncbi:efflux RND transporter permease subunit [Hydrogenophaga sp. BPS33]|uniref:efflux RND transporter permease subunit n=1 Tax=Hydrogenophaga sp. BPS33 TaxID=2651974 RepID=UPI00131F88E1|nr:efflux RND transporter permease subunit [Hydrogenophaga sp. BPS33]QHE85986.1 acriflavine resistance protein B [Hydrogenophaga sp. BPS33]